MSKIDLKNIPQTPGIYIFKDKLDSIIYIGKAKNLKKRVSSYFNSEHLESVKTRFLVKNIESLDFVALDNEVEALLLENKLIKKHKPKYNITLKDSKTYAYIKITDEKIPKITSARKITDKGVYYGPFTDGNLRLQLIKLVISLFKIVSSKTFSSKSYLNYQIGISPARNIDEIDKDEYLKQVERAKEFLSGNTSKILKQLKEEMIVASKNLEYEVAQEKKMQIDAINHLLEKQKVDMIKSIDQDVIALISNENKTSSMIVLFNISKGVFGQKKDFKFNYYDKELLKDFMKIYYSQNSIPKEVIISEKVFENDEEKKQLELYLAQFKGSKVLITFPQKGDKLSLIKLAQKNAKLSFGENDVLVQMKEKIGLPKIPSVIECFDISNLGYEHIVGAMTRWTNGKPDRANYRRFEIKTFKGKNDDFLAIREVIFRRYKNLRDNNLQFPDLIIIDGGKGQLRCATDVLKQLSVKVPIISLAKKEEEIFILGIKDSLKFDKNSKMMLFIRQIRDSVHKYVLSYNKKKREIKLKKEFV